jgi:hypothetical protein
MPELGSPGRLALRTPDDSTGRKEELEGSCKRIRHNEPFATQHIKPLKQGKMKLQPERHHALKQAEDLATPRREGRGKERRFLVLLSWTICRWHVPKKQRLIYQLPNWKQEQTRTAKVKATLALEEDLIRKGGKRERDVIFHIMIIIVIKNHKQISKRPSKGPMGDRSSIRMCKSESEAAGNADFEAPEAAPARDAGGATSPPLCPLMSTWVAAYAG